MLTLATLERILDRLPTLRIGLIGDLFLDRYLEIDPICHELSLETGLEAYQVTRIRNSPGALGTVLNNLHALGVGQLLPLTVVGDDGQADDLERCLAARGVSCEGLLRDAARLTPTYTKPMVWRDGGWHELNRLDLRTRGPISSATIERLIAALEASFPLYDGWIVSDQVNEAEWGVVSATVRTRLSDLARRHPKTLVLVDSRTQTAHFRHAVLKPNLSECRRALDLLAGGVPDSAELTPGAVAQRVAQGTGCLVMCTVGEAGMIVCPPDEEPANVPAVKVTGPIDVVGAGDSATAGVVAAWLAGASPLEAAAVGNLVASLTVQQLGTTGTASPAQVLERWHGCSKV